MGKLLLNKLPHYRSRGASPVTKMNFEIILDMVVKNQRGWLQKRQRNIKQQIKINWRHKKYDVKNRSKIFFFNYEDVRIKKITELRIAPGKNFNS